MDSKKFTITGKHNIDLLTKNKSDRVKLNCLDYELEHELALSILFELNQNLDEELNKEVIKELEKKIKSYKNQDIKNSLSNDKTLIHLLDLKNKLLSSFLRCYYCENKVKLLYRMVRDPLQWTLDRIDNSQNHSNDNTVISCLKCNLMRKDINQKDFLFSRNLNIVKL